jgi:hypothetical protein
MSESIDFSALSSDYADFTHKSIRHNILVKTCLVTIIPTSRLKPCFAKRCAKRARFGRANLCAFHGFSICGCQPADRQALDPLVAIDPFLGRVVGLLRQSRQSNLQVLGYRQLEVAENCQDRRLLAFGESFKSDFEWLGYVMVARRLRAHRHLLECFGVRRTATSVAGEFASKP